MLVKDFLETQNQSEDILFFVEDKKLLIVVSSNSNDKEKFLKSFGNYLYIKTRTMKGVPYGINYIIQYAC